MKQRLLACTFLMILMMGMSACRASSKVETKVDLSEQEIKTATTEALKEKTTRQPQHQILKKHIGQEFYKTLDFPSSQDDYGVWRVENIEH